MGASLINVYDVDSGTQSKNPAVSDRTIFIEHDKDRAVVTRTHKYIERRIEAYRNYAVAGHGTFSSEYPCAVPAEQENMPSILRRHPYYGDAKQLYHLRDDSGAAVDEQETKNLLNPLCVTQDETPCDQPGDHIAALLDMRNQLNAHILHTDTAYET